MTNVRPSDSPSRCPSGRIRTILVVEDETLVRLDISEYLRSCGFETYEAPNAARAIEILEGSDHAIDLVFSDLQMPGETDGIGLAQWIRKNRPDLPILLTSGDSQRAALAKELCENEPFLAKPYDAGHAVSRILNLIETNLLR